MEISFPEQIWSLYNLNPADFRVQCAASGHINHTLLLLGKEQQETSFVLQRINQKVFKRPEIISKNVRLAQEFLHKHHPEYLFIAPLFNGDGDNLSLIAGEYWRLSPFVPKAKAFDVLTKPEQAYEAAKQFGQLSRLLKDLDSRLLEPSIPGFHDLDLRKKQFDQALEQTSPTLQTTASGAITMALEFEVILKEFHAVKAALPLRIMHHDTKISNVLLDEQNFKGVCVIDLDTLMPGLFISDLGDMLRTYLCAVDENEADLNKINIREDFFKATIGGYLSEMAAVLTDQEKQLLLFSGKYIIYMQALRFLADFLQGSTYYPILYPNQNLDRALNQFQLLKLLFQNERKLEVLIQECLN